MTDRRPLLFSSLGLQSIFESLHPGGPWRIKISQDVSIVSASFFKKSSSAWKQEILKSFSTVAPILKIRVELTVLLHRKKCPAP